MKKRRNTRYKTKIELIETKFTVIYNEGSANITRDTESLYAKYIKTNVQLKGEDCSHYFLSKCKRYKEKPSQLNG